ncbi:MAG: septal ring lytic transglycosylase RlpA family protein [Chlorobiales bacterium]|jgi:rare lipoprotein A|nr:septal ring lytic transglycosylase RlpA family protein [Chlorobiales bacterium]
MKRQIFLLPIVTLVFAIGLSACQSTARYTSSAHPLEPKTRPVKAVKPSTPKGKAQTAPADSESTTESSRYEEPGVSGEAFYVAEGRASYYADEFHGRKTSSGEVYDMHMFTAAHRTLPFGTKVKITNLQNSKITVVRINDRGPWKRDRVIDMSLAAAKKLGLIGPGSAKVRIEAFE